VEGDFHAKLEHLFRKQNRALVGMLYMRLGDRESAQDVAQEAYERLFRREREETLAVLRAATLGHLRNYLFRSALNLASNHHRNRRVREDGPASYRLEEDAPSAESVCIEEEERSRLERALEELPRQCRTAFTLLELQGRSAAEAAELMGVKRNTVYQLMRRAYEHLMGALEQEGGKS
jgi:RNA polymerase sigma-70 factor (ECF subfamily)